MIQSRPQSGSEEYREDDLTSDPEHHDHVVRDHSCSGRKGWYDEPNVDPDIE